MSFPLYWQCSTIYIIFTAAACGEDVDDDNVQFYITLRAVDRFFAEFKRYPGSDDHNLDADIPLLKVIT